MNDRELKNDGFRNRDRNEEGDARKVETLIGLALLVLLATASVFLLVRRQSELVVQDNKYAPVQEKGEVAEIDMEAVREAEEEAEEQPTAKETMAESDKPILRGPIKLHVEGELAEKYERGKVLEYTGDDYQLPELYAYWDDYHLEAVDDIIRLERFLPISASLGERNDFYYYGDKDAKGAPEGKGLAVYAYNTYYFGEWKDGKREGNGMWMRIFLDEQGIVNGVPGVKVHSYNGSWRNDYPEGSGQEHFEYNEDYLNEFKGDWVVYNAMGDYKRGLYNGDMLIMLRGNGGMVDWYGSCNMGVFKYLDNYITEDGNRKVMRSEQIDSDYYMTKEENSDFGIAGLK